MRTLEVPAKEGQAQRPLTKKELEKFTATIRKHMETDRFPLKPAYRPFRKLWQDKSKNPIVQDLEFVSRISLGPSLIVEICWAWFDEGNR